MSFTSGVRVAATVAAAVSFTSCMSGYGDRSRAAAYGDKAAPAAESVPIRTRDGVRVGVLSRFGTVFIKEGDYHCAEGSHPLKHVYPDCSGIPVIVLLKPSGGCMSLIPYARLTIHSEKKRTKVEWQIVGPMGYSFDVSKGIDIRKEPGTTDPTNVEDVYDGKDHQGRKFKWELKDTAPFPRTFAHDALVVHTATKVPCEPLDPPVINVID